MDECIYRKAVLSAVGELFTICSHSLPNELGHHYVVEKEIEIFYNYIKDIPAADVRTVVRGKWLTTNDDNKKRCSECDVITLIAQYPFGKANFCPNCGADMRGNIK